MLLIFPFLAWMAAVISAVLIIALSILGEYGRFGVVVLFLLFATAAYCQFLAASAIVSALGLAAQTLLAIYLMVRWKLVS